MNLQREEIELAEGETGYVCNGRICISPSEIGIDEVLLRIGETVTSSNESAVRVGHSIEVDAGAVGQYAVILDGIVEGSFDQNIPASATFSVTRL